MELPSSRHGAYRRDELIALYGRHRILSAVRRGDLRALWRHALVEPSRFLDQTTRAAAAVIAVGPDAVLCGPTAAIVHGCTSVNALATHVLVPYRCQSRNRRDLVIHNSAFFSDDVTCVDGLPVLTLERVAADMLCSARPSDGLALADEVLARNGPDHEATRRLIGESIERRLDPRGRKQGAMLLAMASPRSRSPAESWFRFRLFELGFPLPEVNWELAGIDGAKLYVLDVAWPSVRISVEYDGYAAHVGREAADRAREKDLRRRGWIVVRAAVADLTSMDRVERELKVAFKRRGYTW